MIRGAAALSVLGAAVGALGACGGGIAPGQYVIYRVAFASSVKAAGCYPNDKIPANDANDSTDIRDTGTLIIYAGLNDDLYVDLGNETLQGKVTDTGYSFSGKDVDVDVSGSNDTAVELTTTSTVSLAITVDGRTVSGKSTATSKIECLGPGCPGEIPGPCTQTTNFVGTQIDDVQLQHTL